MRIFSIIFCLGFLLSVRSQNFITPSIVTTLTSTLNETSGLVNLDGEIWTHNDSGDENKLYSIKLNDGSIIRTVTVTDANNVDWEDITCDDTYVFIGDFGNNDGSRTNLRIYRVKRSDIASSNDVTSKKINFSYSDQTSFEPNYHNTNFDCEAFISYQDHLYLFTKNWIDNQTKMYQLPKTTGTHIAQLIETFNINCLVSGAEMMPTGNELLLIGYNTSGGSYTWIFKNFSGNNFFDGNATKLIWTSLTQIEGICPAVNNQAYASSEKFTGSMEPTLFSLDLTGYMTQVETAEIQKIQVYTSHKTLTLIADNGQNLKGNLQLLTADGHLMLQKKINDVKQVEIPLHFPAGIYLVRFISESFTISKKIILL